VRQTPWVFIDCEMTGIDPARDAVIEVAARRMRGDVEEGSLDTLVRSGVPSAPAAQAAHGIDEALLTDAPPFVEVLPALESLLDGAVPVLHGAALDRVFLNRAFEAHGSRSRIRQVIDTVLLARRAVLAKSYRLAAVCDHLGVPPRRWHRAREDVLAVQEVFQRVTSLLRPESARDLWQVRAGVRAPTMVRDAVARTLTAAGAPTPGGCSCDSPVARPSGSWGGSFAGRRRTSPSAWARRAATAGCRSSAPTGCSVSRSSRGDQPDSATVTRSMRVATQVRSAEGMKGFSMVAASRPLRNATADGVNAPPVIQQHRAACSGSISRSAS
jgi:DNA polymerase III epsilon subunit-like protein